MDTVITVVRVAIAVDMVVYQHSAHIATSSTIRHHRLVVRFYDLIVKVFDSRDVKRVFFISANPGAFLGASPFGAGNAYGSGYGSYGGNYGSGYPSIGGAYGGASSGGYGGPAFPSIGSQTAFPSPIVPSGLAASGGYGGGGFGGSNIAPLPASYQSGGYGGYGGVGGGYSGAASAYGVPSTSAAAGVGNIQEDLFGGQSVYPPNWNWAHLLPGAYIYRNEID